MTTTRRLSPLFTWRAALRHDDRLNATARHVGLALSLYMNEAGDSAFPSIRRLADDCARGLSTIQRALNDLEDCGWLTVTRAPGLPGGRGRTNDYRATIPETFLERDVSTSVPGPGNVPVAELNVPVAVINVPESTGLPRQYHATTTVTSTPEASIPKIGSHVPDRWPFFLEKLANQDDAWAKVTIGACVKIAQATSVEAVTTALSFASVSAPVLTGTAYGWLEATAKGLHEASA